MPNIELKQHIPYPESDRHYFCRNFQHNSNNAKCCACYPKDDCEWGNLPNPIMQGTTETADCPHETLHTQARYIEDKKNPYKANKLMIETICADCGLLIKTVEVQGQN